MKIRYALDNEFSLVSALTRDAYGVPYKEGAYTNQPHEVADADVKFRNKEFLVLVAEVSNDLIGAVRWKYIDKEAYLYMLAVKPEMRKQGIGTKLVKAVEEEVRKKAIGMIRLDCIQEKKLPKYYEKLGYTINEVKERLDHHDVYMIKKL